MSIPIPLLIVLLKARAPEKYKDRTSNEHTGKGGGRGGSHEATLYALFRLTSPTYCRIAFVRKIYKDVRTSLWQDFKDRISECGLNEDDFNLADHEMRAQYRHTGNIIKSFGAKAEGGRTAKLKSLAGYNLIIIEECDELSEDEFNTLDDSVRTIKGDPPEIIRIYNPPGRLHWLWKSYNLTEAEEKGYWRASPKSDADLQSIFSTHRDNIDNLAATTLKKWIGYKESNPEYYWTIIEGLISEGQRGRIFTGWTPITQARFQEIDARSVYALDFGEADPAGLVEVKFRKNKAYGRELFYKPMTVKEIGIELCKLGFDSSCLIIADSEDPLNISKLRSGWSRDELSDKELGKMFNGDGSEVRRELKERSAKWELLIGSESCEGFDPVKGCPGHEKEKVKMEVGKIYYLSFGGTEIVGRYKGDEVCHHLFYDYLHQWAGYETYRHGDNLYTVKHGIEEIREATQTEKQALLRKSIEYNTI